MIMATTVQQALDPLLVTSSFIGLGIYFRKKPRTCLNILWSVTVWIAYAYLYYYVVVTFKIQNIFVPIVLRIYMLISALVTISSIITVIYYNEKFRIFMKRIAAVDDTLEQLGTPKIYRKLQLQVKRIITVWLIYVCTGNIIDMIWCLYSFDDRRSLITPFIRSHYRHVNAFVDSIFIILVWYIGTRFDEVNEHIRCLVKENHGLRCTWRKTIPITRQYVTCTDNYKRVLWTSMHLHLELCKIARQLNTMYGTQMTLEMSFFLLFLTELCRYVYKKITAIEKNIYVSSTYFCLYVYFWVLTYMSRLFCINYICENVSAKANGIKEIIHQLTDPLRCADIRDEIYQFTLQLMHRRLKFTGMGLFFFGYNFLRKFCLAIVTFMIIVVQMSPEEDPY